ncbi:MAG: leucine-rich repeat protein [Actinomycetales bacterium]|nr:leucine-rich repeat protein [Actinomycetales bacterium]
MGLVDVDFGLVARARLRGRGGWPVAGLLCMALVTIGLVSVHAPNARAVVTGATFDDGTFTWTFDTSGLPETASITECAITSGGGPCSGAVTIPSSVTDSSVSPPVTYTVTEIAPSAVWGPPIVFANNTSITSVVIPNTVTSIGAYAFYGATALTSVTFGTGVTSIGTAAFSGDTALTSATIPAGVTTISDSVFYGDTALTTVTLPAGLTTIIGNAFRESGLTSISIPNSVTSIGASAFQDAANLATVNFGSGLASVGAGTWTGTAVTSVTLAPGTTSFDASWFSGMNALSTVSIPSSVTAIPNDAFNGKPLTTVTLPSGLVSIGARAFQGTSLTSVQIPSTVTSIGNDAFFISFLLSSITFKGAPPASVGTNIFYLAPATSILIPRGLGWPAPPAPFDGIPTEYATPEPTPAPPAPPGPAPAPEVTSDPSSPVVVAPADSLAPVTGAVGNGLPPTAVKPGSSILLVGGQPVPVVVAPAAGPRPTSVVAAGPGFTASFGGVADDGTPLALGASGALVVQSVQQTTASKLPVTRAQVRSKDGRERALTGTDAMSAVPVVKASGKGFLAGSTIRFYVLPDLLMGGLVADGTGAFAGSVPVPAGIPPGSRALQMNGYAPDGSVRSLSMGIIVTPAGVEAGLNRQTANVYFAPMSAQITAQGSALLRNLISATGSQASMTRIVGFVPATRTDAGGPVLALARAEAVSAYLRSLGLRGPIQVRAQVAAAELGREARRAAVSIVPSAPRPS